MEKWTEGEWTVGGSGRYKHMPTTAILSDERLLANTGGYFGRHFGEDILATENEANAHLMAAAKKLYEALESLKLAMSALNWGELRSVGPGFPTGKVEAIKTATRLAEVAMAAARGETNG